MANQTTEPKPLRRTDNMKGPERERVNQMLDEFERRMHAKGIVDFDPRDPVVECLLEMLVRRRAL